VSSFVSNLVNGDRRVDWVEMLDPQMGLGDAASTF